MSFFELLVGFAGLPWFLFAWAVWRSRQIIPSLATQPTGELSESWPRLSVLVPARNEAHTLEPALKSLLAQDYPNLELVLMDDRSSDGTGEVIQTLAGTDDRVRFLRIDQLPTGWLGKVHALEQGQQIASGEWLLLTDADVEFAPQSLRRLVAWALREDRDYVCVLPEVQARQRWLRAFYTISLSGFFWSTQLWKVPSGDAFVGAGACGLIKRSRLQATPGFSWLRLEVLDDLGLASLAWQSGGKLGVLWGRPLIGLEWYPDFPAVLRGLEKNLFAAAASFQWGRSLLALLAILWTSVAPWLALITGEPALITLFAAAFLCFWGAWWKADEIQAANIWERVFSPVLLPVVAWALLRSTVLAWWHQGISWRGTRHSLTELRKGQRLRL